MASARTPGAHSSASPARPGRTGERLATLEAKADELAKLGAEELTNLLIPRGCSSWRQHLITRGRGKETCHA